MEQKVDKVKKYHQEYGLNMVLQVVGLPKSSWYYHQCEKVSIEDKYHYLKDDLFKIAREHSGYGYRRTTSELKEEYGCKTNHKVVAKLNQCWDLPLVRGVKHPKPSGIIKAIKKAEHKANLAVRLLAENTKINPFDLCFTDFSEIKYQNGKKKAHFMPILDYKSKIVPGWTVGPADNTSLALETWNKAKKGIRRLGFPIEGLILHSDQDPVYTGYQWNHQLLIKDRARLSFAMAGAKENPHMESFFGRFKKENKSLFSDCQTIDELKTVVSERIIYYNTKRRHSSLENKNPMAYLKNYLKTCTKT